MDRQTAINILKKYLMDPISDDIQEAHAMAINALLEEEDKETATKWWTLEEKEPVSGEICMVALREEWRGQLDTSYHRAVYFRKDDEIECFDGTIFIPKESAFYVPMDPRPLGIYWGMLRPTLNKVIKWQINDAPYVPKEYERWGEDYCNYESEGIDD